MGQLSKLISQILTRLRDTSASQRMALLLGGALVAVSLVWLVQWAAVPEMVPLLDQDLRPEEIDAIRNELAAMGEKVDVRGSRVYVLPSANRKAIIAQLQQHEKLPTNTAVGFAALVRESDPWISQTENNRRWTYALTKELEQTLEWLDGVQRASVFLNLDTSQRGFSKHAPTASASVTLVMQGGSEVPRTLALTAARLVAGAVADLKVRDVEVLDASGAIALDWETEQDPTSHLNRLRAKHEQEYTDKIRRQIPDPKARVSVRVELNTTTTSLQRDMPLEGVIRKEDTRSEQTSRMARSSQPGVQPNVGLAAGSGGADETHESSEGLTEFETGREVKTEATPPGDVRLVTAAINLSSSYLETVFQHTSPDAETPGDDDLERVFEREQQRLLPQVARLIVPQDEENVAISWHYDAPLAPVEDEGPGVIDKSLDTVRQHAPESALAVLAMISLGMMLRLAKKGDDGESFGIELGLPKEAIEAAKLAAADVATIAGRMPVGAGRRGPGTVVSASGHVYDTEAGATEVEEAAATEGMLVAQEVDASTVQTRKMLDQVSEMVESDADTVASLLEQWVQRNEGYHESE